MKYYHLTPEMRKEVLTALKSGTTTVEDIRHNIRVQDTLDDSPIRIRETGFMAEFKDGYSGIYEHTLDGELEYFLDRYEHN